MVTDTAATGNEYTKRRSQEVGTVKFCTDAIILLNVLMP